MTFPTIAAWLPLIPYLLFAVRRLLSYLHIFQQEEYDGSRFLPWLVRTRSFDRKLSAVVVVLAFAEWARPALGFWTHLLLALAFLAFCALENDPRKSGKKKLVLTARARRILGVALFLTLLVGIGAAVTAPPLYIWLIPIHVLPFILVISNLILAPLERRIQRKFWQEAHDKLLALKPQIVGITGSFGKTSVKHILGHVLEMNAPTLLTPGSVNTPMGIARVVREQLDGGHRFFICEMGAYGPGSIARLCRLAPPNVAVITAVGYAHYERFKTLDAIAHTKLELGEAVVANGGKAIIAEQVLDFEPARQFYARNRPSVVIVGPGTNADLRVLAVRQTPQGTETDVEWQGTRHTVAAPLFGEHQGINLALVFAAAVTMGVPLDHVLIALHSTPQIRHRLEVKRDAADAITIDDAYNSNPIGFASGLAALDALHSPGGRRILVTPGMVELGAAHEEEHRKIGELAGSRVDVLLPVVPERIQTLIAAYTAANPAGLVVPCANLAAAQAWLSANLKPGDIVLLENDLPDLYEARLAL